MLSLSLSLSLSLLQGRESMRVGCLSIRLSITKYYNSAALTTIPWSAESQIPLVADLHPVEAQGYIAGQEKAEVALE